MLQHYNAHYRLQKRCLFIVLQRSTVIIVIMYTLQCIYSAYIIYDTIQIQVNTCFPAYITCVCPAIPFFGDRIEIALSSCSEM